MQIPQGARPETRWVEIIPQCGHGPRTIQVIPERMAQSDSEIQAYWATNLCYQCARARAAQAHQRRREADATP